MPIHGHTPAQRKKIVAKRLKTRAKNVKTRSGSLRSKLKTPRTRTASAPKKRVRAQRASKVRKGR